MNNEQQPLDWETRDAYHIHNALYHLQQIEHLTKDCLLQVVAELCDEEKEAILSVTDKIHVSHARWLFWYALRYMTNDSYAKIALFIPQGGHKFDARTIQNGANKMAMMIDEEPMWKKRWTIVKRIIKQRQEQEKEKKEEAIVIQVPKGMKEQLKIEVKEK